MNQNKPIITVITVTFNAEKYLEQTILSVIEQDYKNLEYILIDGGSTDRTLDIIKKYEKFISLWISEEDKGIYDAMNKGVKYAKGKFINFMNAGDMFYNNNICSKIFNNCVYADLIYGDTIFYDEKGNENLVKAKSLDKLWQAMIFNHNSLFAKKELLTKYPFDLNYKIVADSKFVIECFLEKRSFLYKNIIINKYLSGGFSDESAILRIIERWKLVSDNHLAEQNIINNYYFKRLVNEGRLEVKHEKKKNKFSLFQIFKGLKQ